MTEWQGAVLSAQLQRVPEQNTIRNDNVIALNAALNEVPGLGASRRGSRMDSQGNYCFVFHYDAEQFAGLSLEGFERALGAKGIPMGSGCSTACSLPTAKISSTWHEPRLVFTLTPPTSWPR